MSMTSPAPPTVGGAITTPYGTPPGPEVLPFPQSPLMQEIAQVALGLGQDVFNWGQNVYNQVGQVTAGNIAQYLDAANNAGGLASSAVQTFQNIANPAYAQMAQQAEQYASTPFIQSQMGEAEATSAQASDSSRQNLIRQMQSYGIDPSAGAYQGLEEAAGTAAAAAEAAAGTQSALSTKAQGQQLLANTVQQGAQYPGFAVNALNAQEQGIAGAENSILGQANTGVNLADAANPYLGTAASLKYPPLGNVPISGNPNFKAGATDSNAASRNAPLQYGADPNTPGPYSGTSRGGPNMASGPQAQTVQAPGGGGRGANAGASIQQLTPGQQPQAGPNAFQPDPGGGAQDFGGGATDFGVMPTATDFGGGATDFGIPQGAAGFGPQDFGGGATDFGIPQAPATDFGGGATDFGTPGASAPTPPQDPNADQGGGYGDMNAYGGSGGIDYSGGDGGDFAAGGGIPEDSTDGGFVSQSHSPSGGHNVDDVPAHLNAEEFVMPRDVARWKGEEFFHKLIAQSRDARMKAAATVGPQMHPGAQKQGTLDTRPGMNMR